MITGFAMVAVASVCAQLSSVAPASPPRRSLSPKELAARGFVAIPAGTFLMGSPVTEAGRYDNEGPQHRVELGAFYMGKYEVTQAEWVAVTGSNPSFWRGDALPVEYVSWHDAAAYCNKKSIMDGLTPCYSVQGRVDPSTWNRKPVVECDFSANGYRLPTEAEWEYACRAGTKTAFYAGAALSEKLANFGCAIGRSTRVGSYPPNAWGLYDMHGNVWEWCNDWYDPLYYAVSPTRDPPGPPSGSSRAYRGGCTGSDAASTRSALRNYGVPDSRSNITGFRIVCRP